MVQKSKSYNRSGTIHNSEYRIQNIELITNASSMQGGQGSTANKHTSIWQGGQGPTELSGSRSLLRLSGWREAPANQNLTNTSPPNMGSYETVIKQGIPKNLYNSQKQQLKLFNRFTRDSLQNTLVALLESHQANFHSILHT